MNYLDFAQSNSCNDDSYAELKMLNLRATNRSADVSAVFSTEPPIVQPKKREVRSAAEARIEQPKKQEVRPSTEVRIGQPKEQEVAPEADAPHESANPAQGQPKFVSSWPPVRSEAFYGLAGEFVKRVEQDTEAARVGLLVQFVVAFGSAIGKGVHTVVEDNKHHCNLFVATIGLSGHGRKGTAWGRVSRLMEIADPQWIAGCIVKGMVSGEGLIAAAKGAERLQVVETEFGGVLRQLKQSNSLSPVLRDAWDGGPLGTLSKKPLRAANAHISIVGHVTDADVYRHLNDTDIANGFANRFLWLGVERSKILPSGGRRIDLADFGKRVSEAIAKARELGEIRRSEDAQKMWESVYPRLTDPRPGLAGAVTSRAEAQVLRLSVVYAALDGANEVQPVHLRAALALWDYCAECTVRIFGDEDPLDRIEERLMDGLLAAGSAGLSRSDIRDVFSRNEKAPRIAAALRRLQGCAAARVESQKGKGKKPVERWFAMG